MRPVYILIFIAVYLTSCNSDNGLPITKDVLMGNWIVVRTTTSNKELYEAITRSKFSKLKNKTELSMFSFQPNGEVIVDYGIIEDRTSNWTFNDGQQLIMRVKDRKERNDANSPVLTASRYKNDTLILENVLRNGKDSVRVKNIFIRLKNNDTIPNLFQTALNKWREKPLKAEDDEAIKTRLKQVLYYYSAYFASYSYNKVPYFNIEKIFCPILFYNGGVGLKKFNNNDEWTKVFHDYPDAEKAHAMLSKAFSRVSKFPSRGNDYVAEYVVVLKMLADKL
jgi:hypothetical protein